MAKRHSPDSVLVLEEEEADGNRKSELGEVRKKRKAATTEPQATGADAGHVISLLDEDDEKQDAAFEQSHAKSPSSEASKKPRPSPVKVEKEGERQKDGGGKLGATALKEQNDDDVQLVAPVFPTIHPAGDSAAAAVASLNDGDDDIQLVGTLNETRLPHMRQHCTLHPFVDPLNDQEKAKASNSLYCDLCFCYVCDKPVMECIEWIVMDHCMASDTGPCGYFWKARRAQAKHKPAACRHRLGAGPFPPDIDVTLYDVALTQCRKCGWFSRFDHVDAAPGCADWCHSCGRVAREQDFGRLQAEPFYPTANDILLGEKTIPFRLHARDPRLFEKFKGNWEQYGGTDPKWAFKEEEMETDLFRHRFGKYPCLEMILASIPVHSVDKIPKTGALVRSRPYEEVSADETEALLIDSQNDRALFEELLAFESIGFKDRFQSHIFADGNIVASWDSAKRSGSFKIQVYLCDHSFNRNWERESRVHLSKFLGVWFDIFPFTLSDICGTLQGKVVPEWRYSWCSIVPCMNMDRKEQEQYKENIRDDVESMVEAHNEAVRSNTQQVSLVCGGTSQYLGGTCATEAGLTSVLKNFFRESFVEDVRGYISYHSNSVESSWIARDFVFVSKHRSIRKAGTALVRWNYDDDEDDSDYYGILSRPALPTFFHSYIKECHHILAQCALGPSTREVVRDTKSMSTMMNHIENLHHPSAPYVEGLTVELLEFQRQSLQWALERENTRGGVQAFFWPKLPSVSQPGLDIYFNPILERFQMDKPRLVRGGIIADEMGLGKTVISLALILENPAPPYPVSGSPIGSLKEPSSEEQADSTGPSPSWDVEMYGRTSITNNKRGRILSRGTLVVCHVSLVGQWIDEARSKLKNPGLVYPYHGQSRKRDAAILAKNAIVVTTYQTLASDASYHAKKKGGDYCAPCEQVRWWRVLCDESHSLRDANTQKSSAVMNLVADNKWLVSGTPVNTTFNDLKNQLKFIGLQDVDELFQTFEGTLFRHTKDKALSKRKSVEFSLDTRLFGHFVFFLRNIMIRHSHRQKYRGTKTTLMSLPPKTEKTIEIKFEGDEAQEYHALESNARQFYGAFKAGHRHNLSKYFLLLSSKLTPLRIAASGGCIPLDDDTENEGETPPDPSSDDETEAKKRKPGRKVIMSDFAYTSKFNTLLAELKSSRDNDPEAKSLVFSQFTTTLEWLQQELPKHGFQFRTLSGDMTMKKRARALHDFQHDPPTTIFLLSMRAGAVGINLTQANRVFLMEPSLNPALEAQAIGRVHRLGQKRNVEIIRLVMKDSVETRLVAMLKKKYGDTGGYGDDDETAGAAASLIGSIHTDRTTMLGAEFDLLFGVTGAHVEPTQPLNGGVME